jgi:hypothetical protein
MFQIKTADNEHLFYSIESARDYADHLEQQKVIFELKILKRYSIVIKWLQRGHNVLDPCGHQLYKLQATWALVDEQSISKEIENANKYCAKQANWINWAVICNDLT